LLLEEQREPEKESGIRRINAAKRFLIGAVACGMAAGGSAGIVAYWPFGMNGLDDASGNGNTLAPERVKFNGGAAVMDGYQTIFSTVSNLNLSVYSALTVECFVKTTSSSAEHMLLEITESAFAYSGGLMMLLNVGASGQLQGRYYTDYALSYKDFTDVENNVADGAWHHVALVVDRTQASNGDRVKLYLDGALQATNSWDASGSPAFKDGKLYIGSRANGSAFHKFVGALDDIRISNAALTPGAFLQERTAEPTAVAYWPFTCGEERDDASGHGNILASSGVAFSNGVAVLNGNDVSFFNTATNLDLSGYTALTVEYFVRTASKEKHFILELGPVTYLNSGTFYHAINNSSNGQLSCSCKMSTDNCYDLSDWAHDVSDGAWHHVAMVFDASLGGSDRVRLYLDGVKQSVSQENGTSPVTLRNEKLYIGSRANGTALPKFIGELDDIRITGAALTPEQFLRSRTESVPTVVAYWPFAAGAELADAAGHGYSLTSDGVLFRKGAAVLDGAQAIFNTASDLQLSPYSMITVEYFLRTVDTNQHFVLEFTTDVNDFALSFNSCINVSGPGLINSLARGSGGYGGCRASKAANDGLWHHVALVFDRAESGPKAAKLYLDGVEQTTPCETTFSNTAKFQNGKLFIGSRNNGTARPKYVGELDDIRITGTALTPGQFMQTRSDPPRPVVGIASAPTPPSTRWYRGNMHLHTYWSDGRGFPEQAVAAYKQRGYDFVCMSDHNTFAVSRDTWRDVVNIPVTQAGWPPQVTSDIFAAYTNIFRDSAEIRMNGTTTQVRLKTYEEIKAQFEEPGTFILFPGLEVTDTVSGYALHMNYLNVPVTIPSVQGKGYIYSFAGTVSDTIGSVAVEVAAAAANIGQPYQLMVNHPFWPYYDVLPQNLIDHPEIRFFEVCNGGASYAPHSLVPNLDPDQFWDAVLAFRRLDGHPLLYGVGSDDTHYYHASMDSNNSSYPGDAWVMVRGAALTPEALIAAMDAGDFYATCGVMLEDVTFVPSTRTLQVKVQEEPNVNYTIRFISTKRGFNQTVPQVSVPAVSGGHPARTLPLYSADIGRTVKTVAGVSGFYQMAEDDLYVRARIDSDRPAFCTSHFHPVNQCAWTQPYTVASP